MFFHVDNPEIRICFGFFLHLYFSYQFASLLPRFWHKKEENVCLQPIYLFINSFSYYIPKTLFRVPTRVSNADIIICMDHLLSHCSGFNIMREARWLESTESPSTQETGKMWSQKRGLFSSGLFRP